MKILITGANGYLGTGIVKEVLDNGNEVIATDFELKFVDERAEKRPCNLFDIEKPYEIDYNGCKIKKRRSQYEVHKSGHIRLLS